MIILIYITGDMHGEIDYSSINTKRFPEQKRMTKNDFLIIAGDFGAIWYPRESKFFGRDRYLINQLNAKNFTTLFVDGNHENFSEIYRYPVVNFMGGKAHKISDSIYHLMRGEIYNIEGKSFFCFGGARSHDKAMRVEGESWWPEEIASTEEMWNGADNLQKRKDSVDFVITHCCSSITQEKVWPYYETDAMTQYLNYIEKNVKFSHWFFGHYHEDREIDERHTCLYNKIIRIH